jgi:hypothetical protein
LRDAARFGKKEICKHDKRLEMASACLRRSQPRRPSRRGAGRKGDSITREGARSSRARVGRSRTRITSHHCAVLTRGMRAQGPACTPVPAPACAWTPPPYRSLTHACIIFFFLFFCGVCVCVWRGVVQPAGRPASHRPNYAPLYPSETPFFPFPVLRSLLKPFCLQQIKRLARMPHSVALHDTVVLGSS